MILFSDNASGYGKTSVVVAIVGSIIIFLHYFLTEEEKAAEKFAITDIWNIVTKNRAFLALVLHYISICAVQAIGSGAALYMYADVMGDIGLQSIGQPLSTSLMFVILIAAPVLTKKWDLLLIMLN